jgi:hypothetical protein
MRITVMDDLSAREHMPLVDTYAIRIFNLDGQVLPLQDSPKYIFEGQYFFDDNDSLLKSRPTVINEDIATKMISDFVPFRDRAKSLLVHCTRGLNRSPAVAIAFNEIFNLGYAPEQLRIDYPEYTEYIYSTLMEAAKATR